MPTLEAMSRDARIGAAPTSGHRRGRAGRMLLAVVLAATLSLVAASCVSNDQTTVFNQVNGSRTSRGVRAMAANQWLADFAQRWAERMAATCTLAHSPDYAIANPYPWRGLAENVGRGPSLASVHTAFMNSPPHRANILNPNFNYLGTGVAEGCGSYWVVHEFMQY